MNRAVLAQRAAVAAAWWVIVSTGLQLVADAVLLGTAGYVTKFSVLQTLLLPVRVVLHPLDPAQAYGAHADAIRPWLYLIVIAGGLLFAWVTLMRHGYLNPVDMLRSEHEIPLSRQLRPKLKDLGIWTPNDAARGSGNASRADKVRVWALRRFFPHKDLARAMVHRVNGMLVPYRGAQPGTRIFLGTYRHLHVVRRKKYNVYARPEQHVVIFGPSGAGKGATQMNPTLLFWNGDSADAPDGAGAGWPGTIITSTVKHDHVDAALEWRLSLSDQCFVYDPLQSYPEFKDYWVGWDPLCTVTNFSEANAVATALMESESQQSSGGGGNEDYFRAQALMVLAPMILSAAMAKAPFRTVYDWSLRLEAEVTDPNVISPDGDVDPNSRTYAVLDKLYEYAETTGDETPLNQMQQVFSKDPREASGVWGSIRKSLQPYNDEKSVQSTDRSFMPHMLDPKKFYSTPYSTLFIIAPEVANEAKRMRPVFAAFITWLIEEAQKLAREHNGKLPQPALANLDEVKNVGAIPGLAHTLSLTRSIGFFVKHAWQDEAQIASAYGKDDAKTITSNSRTWVVLPGISDPEHLDALAKLIGERPVKRRRAKVNPADPDQAQQMRAATASMIKEVKDNELLIITDNLPPFVIEATRYFQDKVMLTRYAMGNARRNEGVMPVPEALRAWKSHGRRGEEPQRDVAAPVRTETLELDAIAGTGGQIPAPALPRLGNRPAVDVDAPRPWEPPPGPAEARTAAPTASSPNGTGDLGSAVSRQDVYREHAAQTRIEPPATRTRDDSGSVFTDAAATGPATAVSPASRWVAANAAPEPLTAPWETTATRPDDDGPAETATVCPDCGRQFATAGMTADQVDLVVSRHQAMHRARDIQPGR